MLMSVYLRARAICFVNMSSGSLNVPLSVCVSAHVCACVYVRVRVRVCFCVFVCPRARVF